VADSLVSSVFGSPFFSLTFSLEKNIYGYNGVHIASTDCSSCARRERVNVMCDDDTMWEKRAELCCKKSNCACSRNAC